MFPKNDEKSSVKKERFTNIFPYIKRYEPGSRTISYLFLPFSFKEFLKAKDLLLDVSKPSSRDKSMLLIITWDYKAEEEFKGKEVKFVPLWNGLLNA